METTQSFDLTDFLLALGVFALFVIFGVCMWFIRREMNKKKSDQKDLPK
jgi:hypothetical protein